MLDKNEGLRFHLYRENGLQNNTVLALYEDRRGNLLLGLDRGIDLVALEAPMTFFTDLTGKIGTVYSAVRWNGRLYIGTNQGAFVQENGGFRLVEGTQGQVWELRIFGGQLLCGHNAGTFQIQESGARLLSDVTGGWCTVPAPNNPGLLVQSTYTGLVVLRQQPGGAWRMQHRVGGFAEPLRKILFDDRGNLWGTHPNKGLYRLRLSPDLTQVLEYKTFRREEGLPSDFKLDLTRIDNIPVINAQFSPLQILDSAGQVVFKPLSRESRRQKWLPGNPGEFFVIDSSGVSLHAAGKNNALPITLVPGYENVVPLSPLEYLFCLENGFALLDKRRLPEQNQRQPAVAIRRLETTGTPLPLHSGKIVLSYRNNNLRIGFAAPYFEQAPLFSWRLEPGAADWSPWQPEAKKEFTNISPGEYVFRIRANSGGPVTDVRFRIRHPWYRSVWAMAGYGVLLIALFVLVERISQIRLDRQRKRLEAENRLELDRQRIEAEREKLALEVETKNRELGNAALNLIRKNEVLQRLRRLARAPATNPAPCKTDPPDRSAPRGATMIGKSSKNLLTGCTTTFLNA
ncbi:MAG: hypothetical protein IPM81_10485 [Saprospirales bacterium]|nr:hypothetical protein [Saprospirales bacterium]